MTTQDTEQSTGQATGQATYDVHAAQDKWRPVWEKLDVFRARDDGSAPRRYLLTMFLVQMYMRSQRNW